MDDLNATPGYLIRRLQQIAVAVFVAEVEAEGADLTPVQYGALVMTRARPGIDQATLAGLIAYDRTTIGGVVDRLVHKGLVERVVSRRDRRARELKVTKEGDRLLDALEPAVARAQDTILSGLDPAERPLFMALLRKAANAGNERSRAPLRLVAGERQER